MTEYLNKNDDNTQELKMTPRILELYKLAHVPGTATDPTNNRTCLTTVFSALKFAELIVRSCADAADMAYDARCDSVGDYVGEYMGYGQEHGITNWRTNAPIGQIPTS